jgi:RNase H-fold protein (predicted Holliday junction resolvase)
MGKRTLKRKRKRKTLRGGDIRNIREVLRNIQLQVDGEEVDGDHENGFYGRLYTLIEDEHMTNLAVGNPILDQQLNDMVSSLREFVDRLDEANATAELTLDYVRTLRTSMMSTLEEMMNIAQDMDESASPISDRMLDEINAEIVFIQEQFNTLDI